MIKKLRKRNIEIMLWLNDEEIKLLRKNASKCGLSHSEYIRNLINGHKPKEQPTDEIFTMLNQLRGIATNLNQIARKANTLNFVDVPYYKKTYQKLSDFIKKFENEFMDID